MSADEFAALREEQYGGAGPGIFVNNASWGVSPRSSVEAVADFTRRRGRVAAIGDGEFGAILDRGRRSVADLLEVDPAEVALAPNTSYGINLGVHLARTRDPGRIVVSEGEFPANVLPWLVLERDGYSVEVVPATAGGLPDEDALEAAVLRPGAVALSLSAVQFATGHAADLARLGAACRRGGAWFVVDAIQGCGVVPLRPREIGAHLVAAGAQKWLCGPWGSGFCWVAGELHERLDPPLVSWLAVEGATDFSAADGYRLDWLSDARRYELATLGTQDVLGMAESIDVLLRLGVGRIRARIHDLHAPLLDWADRRGVRVVTPRDPARRAGIVALELPEPEAVLGRLTGAGVQAAVREGYLRVAPHWWVAPAEMERLVTLLEGAVDRPGRRGSPG